METVKKRERMVEYALSFLGVPYFWGGDDFSAFDCSGLCIEAAKSIGLLPHQYDNNANGLWERFKVGERHEVGEDAQPGDFVFWFKDDWAMHIELALNETQTIGASGGGRPEFDLYKEAQRDEVLSRYYSGYSREEFFAHCMDHYSIKQLRQFLIQDEAIRRNAFIKVRPMIYRGLKFKIADPFKYGES